MAGEKILVVDDEAHIRQALRAALESEDFIVEEAENGKIAVEKTKTWRPRLVLMDVRMPEMDGHMASIEIKYDESIKNTKLIFLTANADEDSRNYGLGHGAEGLVSVAVVFESFLDNLDDDLATLVFAGDFRIGHTGRILGLWNRRRDSQVGIVGQFGCSLAGSL